jgi:leader peptidase (prepilin peptidase) / N-methyltransferase
LVIIYLFLFLLGAALGSFFNVCISRIPLKKSIILPASHCPVCGTRIRKSDNIPILSYLFLKGKCRNCRTPIPLHYLSVELLTPILFLLMFNINGSRFDLVYLKYFVFISFGIILFVIDLRHKILPDKLTLPLLVTGLIFAIIPELDITFKSALTGSISGFVLFFLLAYFFQIITKKEALGGGDIKLIAGIGIYVGIYGVVFTIIFASVIALLTLLLIRHDLKKEFPFGPFLILAAAIHVILGDFLIRSYLDLFL